LAAGEGPHFCAPLNPWEMLDHALKSSDKTTWRRLVVDTGEQRARIAI